jgi:EAL domain-containing protein (putative c-di-GMP-specific phosphodiesterase class I)/GGDEF domain-containing protein
MKPTLETRREPSPPAEDPRQLRSGFLRLKSALHDPVTGLSSYHLHLGDLEMRLEGRRLGIVVLEFPGLGALETAHGWEAGDRFLAGVASLLGACRGRALPEDSLLALDGVYGDAFTLFLVGADQGREVSVADLSGAAERLHDLLRARLETALWAAGFSVDVSIGYALVWPNPTTRFERMVHQGIREARGMTARDADRLQHRRLTELRAILQEGRLTTHYQPIVEMESGAIMGYEALTRGPRDTSLEGPEALFACSRSARLSSELDAACRRQALRGARGFDPAKKLFLNALPETLGAPGFVDRGLRSALEEAALQPRHVVLEITERTAIEDFEAFGRELDRLRGMGFLVAIDDVGTGYSSLQTISEVAADFLKIDISLIKNIHQSLIKQDLVHSLLQVASRTETRVIAEGIESAEEYRALRSCGVRYGQGFYIARPAPAFAALARDPTGSV